MLEGEGRFINRPTKTGKKLYDKHFIYIPTDIARDSSYPFKIRETVKIIIDQRNKRLIIEKTK